jgi:hypothetical protein
VTARALHDRAVEPKEVIARRRVARDGVDAVLAGVGDLRLDVVEGE